MVFFITVLRALAACLITNSHYEGIYPTDIIANGGLLGNVLFFAVSGYCLANIKYDLTLKGFAQWYGKRIWRIYPPMTIATIFFIAIGYYKITEQRSIFYWFVFPTCHAFITAIVLLYIPFFFLMKIDLLRNHLKETILGIFIISTLVYLLCYDRSYYHVDSVAEPFIYFIYLESMLLGAYFRQNDAKIRDQYKKWFPVAVLVSAILYFASKLLFAKGKLPSQIQILNQVALFLLLYFVFRTFAGIDKRLNTFVPWLKKIISFIADMTLEIYIVQIYFVIQMREMAIGFPMNWVLLTAIILISAYLLHLVTNGFYKVTDKIAAKERR